MRSRNYARSNIPASFQIGRYSIAESFDIVDWTLNLEARGFLLHCASSKHASDKGLKDFADSILNDPLIKATVRQDIAPPMEFPTVTDFTVEDYFWCGEPDDRFQLYKETFDKFRNNVKISDVDRTFLSKPTWLMFMECDLGYEENVAVNVNLHSSEDKIIRDFTNWLRKTRACLSISVPRKPVKLREFEEWSKYKVLPFLDLWLWSMVNGVRISHQDMGVALFPNDVDVSVSERIRKVVAPLARDVCAESFTDALRDQARYEIASGRLEKALPHKFANIGSNENGWVLVRS